MEPVPARVTPADLAQELGVDARTVRRWLRATWPPTQPHSLWEVSPEQVDAVRTRFGAGVPESVAPTPRVAVQDSDWSPWVPLDEALDTAPLLPGVYMARRTAGGPVVYVGMAGERRGQGIRGRLAIYVSGKGIASGLGEAVFDRALADADWLEQRLAEVRAGQPIRAKLWGRAAIAWADLDVRWQTTADRASALELEIQTIRALSHTALWNRYR